MPAPRVILVDDSPEFLERAQSLLSEEFNVIGAFADGHAVRPTDKRAGLGTGISSNPGAGLHKHRGRPPVSFDSGQT